MSIAIKFCGITNTDDIAKAVAAGASHLGFITVPSSKRFVSRQQLKELLPLVPSNINKVLVSADTELSDLQSMIDELRPDAVQLHGKESSNFVEMLEGAEIWKSFHLKSKADLTIAEKFPAEFLLLDSEQAGSGKLCDWGLAAELAQKRKIFLAGGLHPGNVFAALSACPFAVGLDCASGIEKLPGKKDEKKMIAFVAEVRKFERRQLF